MVIVSWLKIMECSLLLLPASLAKTPPTRRFMKVGGLTTLSGAPPFIVWLPLPIPTALRRLALIGRTIVLSAEEEGNIRNAWEDKENDIEEVIASLKALETYEEMK